MPRDKSLQSLASSVVCRWCATSDVRALNYQSLILTRWSTFSHSSLGRLILRPTSVGGLSRQRVFRRQTPTLGQLLKNRLLRSLKVVDVVLVDEEPATTWSVRLR